MGFEFCLSDPYALRLEVGVDLVGAVGLHVDNIISGGGGGSGSVSNTAVETPNDTLPA